MSLLHTRRGRALLFTALYASEGAPIGFIWWSLPAILRERGAEVGAITGVLATVTAMWAVKFLWAPAVDAWRGPRWGFRSWILGAQALMGLTLLPLAWLDPLDDLRPIGLLLLAHALAATTQDVSIDALAIRSVPASELGRINGCMAAGKFLGRGLFGGAALVVAEALGWRWIVLGMVAAIWSTLALVWSLPEQAGRAEPTARSPAPGPRAAFAGTLRAAFGRRSVWLALAFALVSGAGFEAVGALTGPYLVDRGLALADIGWFRAVPVVGALTVGSLLGGVLTDRLGRRRASALFLLGFVGAIVLLGAADLRAPRPVVLLALLTAMYFFCGMFLAASYALFMRETDPRLGATQFSTFMAATNGCEAWSTRVAGSIVDRSGYVPAFLALGATSLLALPLLRWLSPRTEA